MLGNISLQNKSIMTFSKRERNPSSLKNMANTDGFPLCWVKKKKVKSHLNKNQLQWLSYFDDCLIDAPPNEATSARCLGYSF